MGEYEKAKEPEDLDRLFLERSNKGDLEGVVALYEPYAVLAFPAGQMTIGREKIRAVYEKLLASKIQFQGEVQPALRNGDLALTSTRFPGNATTEVARQQPDGTWLWIIDQPSVLK
jgi:ketosteroid isomerase-like protein